ncbi:TIGR03364 family FAD-dependent oxidoreductase [Microbacterium testaceum]|uniref:TIGR03364 family FAD-dependent oxidoreductase n=1 Tax=Microbacterium testaceum TaxID=2033 RepID=UPI0025B20A87|nr:TIGR03364 family FAD-dependent oxidoreductase [Microbacterium testaceum]WJS90097.1 TIGR03364 family FAD-dependent oxidoreductase [Microbacterium testaceum]
MHSHSSPTPLRADVVVVGAGIVGLAHAWHAVNAGLSVVVVDRDDRAVGASVRNFGHICTTAQSGRAREYAVVARETWLRAGAEGGLAVSAHGTVVAARSVAEMAVLDEFASGRDRDEVRVLGADETADRLGWAVPGLVGGALMPRDLRVDSPAAVPALTAHLARLGVVFRFGENVVDVVDGVRTTHGSYVADTVIVCVGHDVDRLFPVLASDGEVRRCRLRMMEIDPPRGVRIDPGVFTGSSLLRYGGFAETAAADTVRAELASLDPDMLTHTVNLMCTQRPDGRVVIGDTHHYERTLDPFDDEALDALLLDRFCGLFGVDDLVVRRRWRGVYAASAQGPYLHASPRADVVVASVTSGIGMTTAFGFARDVLAQRGLIP